MQAKGCWLAPSRLHLSREQREPSACRLPSGSTVEMEFWGKKFGPAKPGHHKVLAEPVGHKSA